MNATINYQIFRSRLTYLITQSNKRQATVSVETGIRPATLSRYLSGDRTPDLEYVAILADYFGVSMDWLMGRSDDGSELMRLYSLASDDDKLVIDTILKKYKRD